MSVVVVATIVPRPEHRDEVIATRLEGKLAGPAEVIVLQAVPAGDPARGQL